jgi:hypothetical protein
VISPSSALAITVGDLLVDESRRGSVIVDANIMDFVNDNCFG